MKNVIIINAFFCLRESNVEFIWKKKIIQLLICHGDRQQRTLAHRQTFIFFARMKFRLRMLQISCEFQMFELIFFKVSRIF